MRSRRRAPDGRRRRPRLGACGIFVIRVAVPDSSAISGLTWYNNDASVVFPSLVLCAGFERDPGEVDEGFLVAESFSGASSGWSSIEFLSPIVASLGAVYLVFQFPEGSEYQGEGYGGGAAFGYSSPGSGCGGWISGDGTHWLGLDPDYGFSVVPSFVPAEDYMTVKSMDPGEPVPVIPEREYLTAGPNPFNPRCEVKFGIRQSGNVSLRIYDIRGHMVSSLANRVFEAGHHAVVWEGRNSHGGPAASGVYFCRIQSETLNETRKLMLVR